MEQYNTLCEFLDEQNRIDPPLTEENRKAFIKSWGKIHGYKDDSGEFARYKNIMVSISGGADSDIMLDMIERIGCPLSETHYVFFNTGLEFQATKDHLKYLEDRYGIEIEKYRANIPVPLGCQKYGLPFLSKQVSQFVSRLQRHNFKWEDRPFEELYAEYPRCKAALRWWCNEWGEGSKVNINRNKLLKEFMVENPPDFLISDGCCKGAKKDTAHEIERKIQPDLSCVGVRKAEGGARSSAYKSCFDENSGSCAQFRPIFWMKNDDKENYEQRYDIKHSECYTVYGLKRTGCACCPFGKNFEKELEVAKEYEPKLYIAANNVFGKSYDYTRKYKEFRKNHV